MFIILILGLFSITHIPGCAIPSPPQRTAIIFGISLYDDAKAVSVPPNLPVSSKDAEAMDSLLLSQGWDSRLFLNEDASMSNLISTIDSLRAYKGLVLFYFAGHGGFDQARDASFFIPQDSWDADLNRFNASKFVYPEDFKAWFREAGIMHGIVILDSCNSGDFVQPGSTTDAIPQLFGKNEQPDGSIKYTNHFSALGDAYAAYAGYTASDSMVVISAGGVFDVVWENSSHGIFTYFLLQAPKYADSDRDGYVTTTEVYRYTANAIKYYWNKSYESKFDSETNQYMDYHPHLSGNPREYILFTSK